MFTCRICCNKELNEEMSAREMMFGSGKIYKYYKCSYCGVLQIEKPVNNISELYPDNYSAFADYKNNLLLFAKKFFLKKIVASELGLSNTAGNFLKKNFKNFLAARALKDVITPDMKILDVGCGKAELIEALYNLGYKGVSGVEPFAAIDTNKLQFPVHQKFLLEIDENEKYDLIMLHHSFEHMENPADILKKIRRLLAVNGTCLIRIPVCDSTAFEYYKEDWVQLDAPRHIFLHTDKSMRFLCEQAGLNISQIKDDSYSFQFIGSEQYKQGIGLSAEKSYYRPFYKKLFFKRQHIFSSSQVHEYEQKAEELNRQHKGDQRIYIINAIER